ncbi:MAG: MopE-related protein [Myxococcota bacterium]|nr:MopE-related protein [Myxococcota bacterium]
MHRLAPVVTLAALVTASACAEHHPGVVDAARDAAHRSDAAGGLPPDASTHCAADSDCDDGLFCSGIEECRPRDPSADVDGCVTRTRGCTVTGCSEARDRCLSPCWDDDRDGHGSPACGGWDCDDGDPDRHPDGTEVCDAAGHDEDCNPHTFGPDEDDDGHIVASCCVSGVCGDDCDDARRDVHPGAVEAHCDLIDDDCDGALDEGLFPTSPERTWYPDCDDDGRGDDARGAISRCRPIAWEGCGSSTHWIERGGDCDDRDGTVYLGARELCDGRDHDCDGAIDRTATDADGDGYVVSSCSGEVDCNDLAATIHPGATELCNRRDDDCDGHGNLEDADRDGHAALDATCTGGWYPRDDCDDRSEYIHPGAPEACNGGDDDCDGALDEGAGSACRVRNAAAVACESSRCVATSCEAGYAGCVVADSCDTRISQDELHCGGCDDRCSSAACVGGVCDPLVELAPTSTQTCGRTASGAAVCTHASTGVDRIYERTSGGGTRVHGGLGLCVIDDGRPTCDVRWTAPAPVVVDAACSLSHACGFAADGEVLCWGLGDRGQMGDGVVRPFTSWTPIAVGGVVDAVAIDVGGAFSCVQRRSGAVACWGAGTSGQLGHGTDADSAVPVVVAGLDRVVGIAAGLAHACALRDDGGVWCWGDDANGQLGRGTLGGASSIAAPIVSTGTPYVAVTAGSRFTCAITSAGAVECWGDDAAGQLGDGAASGPRGTPIAVSGLTRVVEIAAGASHACARRDDGSIWCWGNNASQQLGDGTTTNRDVPTLMDFTP